MWKLFQDYVPIKRYAFKILNGRRDIKLERIFLLLWPNSMIIYDVKIWVDIGLIAWNYYLNQYWYFISEVLWYSPGSNSIAAILHGELEHDDVIKWKNFPCYWPFVRGIHRSPVNSPHKGQWRGALMFTLICAWINGWVNNREAGDLRRYRPNYDIIVMNYTFWNYCYISLGWMSWGFLCHSLYVLVIT